MPPVLRRIVALLIVACLGAGAQVSLALAQGAGDQQYEDPFGDSGTSTTQSTPKAKTTPSTKMEPLSSSPQSSNPGIDAGSGSGSGVATPSTDSEPAPAAAAQGLPNTGADARVLLAVGAALLLIGFGLRLRSAPERF